ncbi:hypothetical protein [Hyalangium rubrum]|uniref:Lipoprotein n=1 Tax=Hyalangium rubrum TaxID=3103134 RepID=A0ABU5GYJ8_9BACT|nr:hypothetical protein [Hyalangium sp. s54d21]MDY7226264.1 hypothetical protein [Hyalangium sp. s54d21]
MGRLGVTGAVVALLALTACGGARQEREKKEQEAAAAEKKLSDARAFHEGLEREKTLLAKKLAEARGRKEEVRGLHHQTLAGAAYLAAEKGSGLVLDAEMTAAREGFQLEEATRQKDGEALKELVSTTLDDLRPCVASKETDEMGDACPPCEVAPFEDACVGVETNRIPSPEWECEALARTGEGLPPAAFCTFRLRHSAPAGDVSSDYAERDLSTWLRVVRVAFAHQGRLHVSDFPAPDPTLYNPANVEPLVACKAETSRNQCIHDCEVSFDRYDDPCACSQPEPAYDTTSEYSEPGDEEDAEDEEPYEVRQAREAAAAAQAEAEEAQARVQEAEREFQYQQCLSVCEPEKGSEAGASDEGGAPVAVSTEVAVKLQATPAPGIFVVSRELSVLDGSEKVLERELHTLVLKHPALVSLWLKEALPNKDALGELEEVAALSEVLSEGGKPSLAPLPGMEGPTLIGLQGGKVRAYAFKNQPGQAPVVALEPQAVCAAMNADPKRFPEAFLKSCAEPAPVAAEVDAGTPTSPEEPADAGTSDAGTSDSDAGTSDAGEVAP